MKRTIYLTIAAVFLFCCKVSSQQLVAAEYFYDTDPGVGNGTALTVTTGDSILYSGTISTAGLPVGFHFLYIRTKNSNHSWSIAERRMLSISTATTISYSLAAAEYFFDSDPGVGNGTSLSVTAGDSILYSGTISSTGLLEGFHFLYIRAKGNNGIWCIAERRMLYISSSGASSPTLTAAEYYFDSDPGVGNGTALPVLSGDTIDFSGIVSSASLGTGFHFLHIRAKGADEKWSIAERRMVYVQDPAASLVLPPLVAAEYFVDTDPGLGNGLPIPVISGDSIDFSGPLVISNTADGYYHLFIRVRDSANNWSAYEERQFEIRLSGVSVNEITASDKPVLFQNFPNPFNNNTTVEFYLDKPGNIIISVTDFLGREVRQIRNENLGQGMHSLEIDHSELEQGYYFYKLAFGDFTDTKKMILLRQ